MSKYSQTELNRANRLRERILDLYSRARAFKMSHDDILAEQAKIMESGDWKRASGYTRAAMRERLSTEFDRLYLDSLDWGFPQDGRAVNWDELAPETLEAVKAGKVSGFHYYKGTESSPRKF